MAEGVPRGTVTPLSSVLPAEEAQMAAKRVHEAISERETEVGHLERFISDNNALLKLVGKLPEEISHQIMVPFGKAAFFPGRLIHTNEFLVLLGDGYYAERTSKQTTEILLRREKVLKSKLESLKATVLDLEARASFFDAMAAEAAEGLMEIREEYIEEQLTEWKSGPGLSKSNSIHSSESDEKNLAVEDKEYDRIMSRLEELEKEEQKEYENDEDNDFDSNIRSSGFQLSNPVHKFMDEISFNSTTSRPSSQKVLGEKSTNNNRDLFQFDNMKAHLVAEDESSHSKEFPKSSMVISNIGEKPLLPSKSMESSSKIEKVHSVHQPKIGKDCADNVVDQTARTSTAGQKAFTGSIIEHSHGMPSKLTSESSVSSSQAPGSNPPSKPVSRFKMQKGGR